MKLKLFSVLLFFSLSGCDLFFSSLIKTWKVTKVEEDAKSKGAGEKAYLNNFFSFYPKGVSSFLDKKEAKEGGSESEPVYETSHWEQDGDVLTLTDDKTGRKTVFRVVELTKSWLVLQIAKGGTGEKGTLLKCQVSERYRSDIFDLLFPPNNDWRKRPKQKEDKERIKKRVLQHVQFLLNYFRMVEDNAQGFFEPAVLHTPFQFYANGLGLLNDFESTELWASNFYDLEEAELGAKMLRQGLRSIEVYPKDNTSYTKGYYKALLLVKAHIEK